MTNMMRKCWIFLLVIVKASSVSTYENIWLRQANEGQLGEEFDFYDEPCIECCETRDQGSVVVIADILEDCKFSSSTAFPSSTAISSSRPPSSSVFTSPTTPGCICCEFRKHGYVVVVAEIDGPDAGC